MILDNVLAIESMVMKVILVPQFRLGRLGTYGDSVTSNTI
jgi:hypothetical protein